MLIRDFIEIAIANGALGVAQHIAVVDLQSTTDFRTSYVTVRTKKDNEWSVQSIAFGTLFLDPQVWITVAFACGLPRSVGIERQLKMIRYVQQGMTHEEIIARLW